MKLPHEKAYKILALQENISHKKAKILIDRGQVFTNQKRVKIARENLPQNTILRVSQILKIREIFRDENVCALEKPPFVNAPELLKNYENFTLLNRLDRETSGVILLVKNGSDFHKNAIEEFRAQRVFKEYFAVAKNKISMKVGQNFTIKTPLKITKNGFIKTLPDPNGRPAHTQIFVEKISKNTLLKIHIKTGLSHQIRAHLNSIGMSILGDTNYGGTEHFRMMLHAHKIAIFDYHFTSQIPQDFFEAS